MMRRFWGLGTVLLFTTWTLVGSAQEQIVRLGTPYGAPPTLPTPVAGSTDNFVVANGSSTASCGPNCGTPAPCACKAELAFQPCNGNGHIAKVLHFSGGSCNSCGTCNTCATGACAAGSARGCASACTKPACTTGCCSNGGYASGNHGPVPCPSCAMCPCTLGPSCDQKPRAYCVPRPYICPNVCCTPKCNTCNTGVHPCGSCTGSTPCAGGCSSGLCACAANYRPMFPVLARLGRAFSGDFHSQSPCNSSGTSSCGSGTCSTCAAAAAPMPVASQPATPVDFATTRAMNQTQTMSMTTPVYSATPVIGR